MKKIQRGVFRIIKYVVTLVYPKTELVGQENLPQEPYILVGNHSQMHGPILSEIAFPDNTYTWCASEMMCLKEVPAYAYKDFWSRKPRWCRWFYKILSYVIAPFSVLLFNNARTIPVYHDKRVLSTFRDTVRHLDDGANIIIFPEHDVPHNHIVCDFQEGFIDTAKLYCKRNGKPLPFVPMYIAPALHKIVFGKPIYFDPEAALPQERTRICQALMNEITDLAIALPPHRVVPYNNVPKKQHPQSK